VEVIGTAAQVIASDRIAPPRNLSFNPQDWAILKAMGLGTMFVS
jgi:hypothetical protein